MEVLDFDALASEKTHEFHKRLWDWLAKNPNCGKYDWPEWTLNGGEVLEVGSDCFACELDDIISKKKEELPSCNYCPITWEGTRMISGVIKPFCNTQNSSFWEWKLSTDPVERTRLAEIIRDMPWTNKGLPR